MTVGERVDRAAALAHCREVTRSRARNFYHGLKLLPEPERSALYAIYAWMRRADDLVDEATESPVEARAAIARCRAETSAALAGHGREDDPVLVGLQDTAARYRLSREPFDAMLDGQLDDLNDRVYETFDDLREYCRRVASSVGLVCVSIWGYDDDRAPDLAVDRGIAFQLTNILRDFVEDHALGRVYLPADDFRAHDLSPTMLRTWSAPDRCEAFVREQVERAESYYVRSEALDGMIDPTCRPTLWAMTRIYHGLLARIRADPSRIVLGPRVRLNALRKGTIALRARFGAPTRIS